MAAATEILEQLAGRGVQLVAAGADRLQVRPRSALDAAMRELLREHKAELIEALRLAGLVAPYGVTIADVRERLGADSPAVERDYDLLRAVAVSIRDRRLLGRGQRPPGWDVDIECAACGPVTVHGGYAPGARVPCCPWCIVACRTGRILAPPAIQKGEP